MSYPQTWKIWVSGRFEKICDLKLFSTLWGKNKKMIKFCTIKQFRVSLLWKLSLSYIKIWIGLYPKVLNFFFNKSMRLLKQGLNITRSKKTESFCRQLGLFYFFYDFIFLFIIFQFVSNQILRAGSLIPFSIILCAGCTALLMAPNLHVCEKTNSRRWLKTCGPRVLWKSCSAEKSIKR